MKPGHTNTAPRGVHHVTKHKHPGHSIGRGSGGPGIARGGYGVGGLLTGGSGGFPPGEDESAGAAEPAGESEGNS